MQTKKAIISSVLFFILLSIVSWLFSGIFLSSLADNHLPNGDYSVRITRTGELYHYSSCSYLHSSSIEITLEEAVSRGYGRCSRCDPPKFISETDYIESKASQPYIANAIIAIVSSIPSAAISFFITMLLLIIPEKFVPLIEHIPDRLFKLSMWVVYVPALIQGIRLFFIW